MGFRSDRCTPWGGRRPSGAPSRPLRLAVLVAVLAACMLGLRPGVAWSILPLEAGGRDRLLMELERTDRVLERAMEQVVDCPSPKAKLWLREARELQQKARDLYRAGGPTLPTDRIFVLTRHARELAVDAIEQCQVETKAEDSLRSLLDTIAGLLDQSGAAVRQSGIEEAQRLLDAGAWQFDRARSAYRTGEYRRAILLAGVARNLVLRAVDRTRGAGSAGSRIDLALDRTDALLSEVRSTAGWEQDPRARALLEKAERSQDRARQLQADGAGGAALQQTRSARETALDALWLLQRAPEPTQVEGALTLVRRLLDQASPEIDGSGSEEAKELRQKAAEELRRADEALRAGDLERAAASVHTADALLRRAVQNAER